MDHIATNPVNTFHFSNLGRVSPSVSDSSLIQDSLEMDSSIDALHVLLEREERLPCVSVDPLWSIHRSTLLDWGYRFADSCDCNRSVIAKAAKLADQFLSSHPWHQLEYSTTPVICQLPTKDERLYMQLTSIVSIEIAMKLLGAERYPSLNFLSWLTQSEISENELELHEFKMLDTLHWDVNPPIPQEFVHEFTRLIPHRENIALACESALFQIEISVLKPDVFSAEKMSAIALAALLNGLDIATNSGESGHNYISEMDIRHFENLVSREIFKDPNLIGNLSDLREKLQRDALDMVTQIEI